ncbi:MAG: ribokinase [Methylobacteriaceae bacterium]|nr:ribokinase [Methylobacteriaceae bacterium]
MIVVFGSINIDLITRVAAIPRPGETVLGSSYALAPGGKGANQALAARRAGARVRLAGAVGADAFAEAALALLRADGVDLTAVAVVDAPTGAAFIAVDAQGENAIVVASGANGHVRAGQLEAAPPRAGDLLLLQRETPEAEALAAARAAKTAGARVALNLAPAGRLAPEWLALLDFLILNEHEAATLGRDLGLGESPEAAARAIAGRHGFACIVTLGSAGVVAFAGGTRLAAPAAKVAVVDTTGAGDAFVGAFAAAIDGGLPLAAALRRGSAAGALACTKEGAQPSLPSAADIAALAAQLDADETRRD